MCVIFTAAPGTMPTMEEIQAMSACNRDGAGIAWHDGERLHRFRNADNEATVNFISAHWRELKKATVLGHFRLATNGSIAEKNTHPFRFNSGYIAHNGIASDFTRGRFASDTRNLCSYAEAHGTSILDSGREGKTAELTVAGGILWHYGETKYRDYSVSNTYWVAYLAQSAIGFPESGTAEDWDDYQAGYSDGYGLGEAENSLAYASMSRDQIVGEFDYSRQYGHEYAAGFADGYDDYYTDYPTGLATE